MKTKAQWYPLFVAALLCFGCASRVPPARTPAESEARVHQQPRAPEADPSEELVPAEPARMSNARRTRESAVVPVIRGQLRAIQGCYETLLAANPELDGRVRVFFTLDVDGTVSKARATVELRASAPLAECIVDIIRASRFPADAAGDYEYPFVFAPQN